MRIVRASLSIFVAGGAIAAFFVACGLDESGTLDGSALDASSDSIIDVRDAAPQDSYVAPTCQTIDATCLGDLTIPAGWVLLDVSDSGTTCPGDSEDWETHPLIINPVPDTNACACQPCVVDGGYSCNGTVNIVGGVAQCNDHDASIGGGTAQCVSMTEFVGGICNGGTTSVGVTMPAPSGSPGCYSQPSFTNTGTATPMLGCKPQQCTTDYCGLHAQGFETCILHNNDPSGACPAGYRNAFGTTALASVPGNYTVNCASCTCDMGSVGGCTGTLRVFAGAGLGAGSCDGDGSVQGTDYKETLDATACQSTGLCGFGSLYYVPNQPPSATCATTNTQGSGDASLTNPVTICCAGP